MTRSAVFFDFDGTLTHGDSLLPFLRMLVGGPRFFLKIAMLSPVLAAYVTRLLRNDIAKEIVLRGFLQGMKREDLEDFGRLFASRRLPSMLRPAGMERLRWHQAQGHVCVLVSASLDIYLAPWAATAGFDGWITSSLEIDAAGSATGRLQGGNCFGDQKVERIRAWLSDKDCIPEYAYGDNRTGDGPMLLFATQGFIRNGDAFCLYADRVKIEN